MTADLFVPRADSGRPGFVIHDLSFDLSPGHFRWRPTISQTARLEAGDAFQTTRFEAPAHCFTHADAPSHVVLGGQAVHEVDLATFVGPAAVIDLSDVVDNEALTADRLKTRAGHLRAGDIALLRTDWDVKHSIDAESYWTAAPYVTSDGAVWLLDAGVRCVGFDFPQDHAIRAEFKGEHPGPSEFITHQVLLARGVGLVEYLRGLAQIRGPRTFFSAAPIKIAGSDGAPARAYALDQLHPHRGQ